MRPLLPGSPAIDAGDNQYVTEIPVDQRGAHRVSNGRVDIGAFEYEVILDPGASIMTADPALITTDDTSTIVVQLKDPHGVSLRVGGDEVTLHTTHGTLSDVTDHGDGTYSATLNATELGTATIIGAVNDAAMSSSATVEVRAGAADATKSTIIADSAMITTDGTSTITVQLKDTYGNDLVAGGDEVMLHTTHGTLTEVADHDDGTYSATLSATTPGVATITGTVGGVLMATSITLEVSVGAADATTSTIAGEPGQITTDGTSTITVQLKDAHGNSLTTGGDEVTLHTTHGNLTEVANHDDGTYSATLSATTPGIATITGTVNGAPIADVETVEVGAGVAQAVNTVLTATPSEVFIGSEGALVTVRLFDAHGNALPKGGDDVQISTDFGELRRLTDQGDGSYTAIIVAFSPGIATIAALVNGEPVAKSISVTFVEHDSVDEDLQITQTITPRYSQAGDVVTITITVNNVSGRTQQAVSVVNHLSNHLEYIGEGAFSALMATDHSKYSTQSISPTNLQPAYDPNLRTVTWTYPTLAPGERAAVELSFQAVVNAVPEGTVITNLVTANVLGTSAVASASATTTVGQWPDLAVRKTADQKEAAIGELVRYRVSVANEGTITSHETRLIDTLPAGFVYVEGSSRVNGSASIEPTATHGRLVWNIGDMAPGDEIILEYLTHVSLEAAGSDGINRIVVEVQNPSGFTFNTDPVTALVRIRSGMFGSLGSVTGTVYHDENRNGERDPGEPGLAGVVIYTDDGRRIVTDVTGRYLIPGLYPGLRSLKVHEYGESVGGETYQQSHFVYVPVGGMALLNFGLPQAAAGDTALDSPLGDGFRPRTALPSPLLVGTVDLLYPSGGSWELRYGSFFGHRQIGPETTITVRHRAGVPADLTALEGILANPPLIGESRQSGNATPEHGNTFLQLRSGRATLTYGAMRPEDRRGNRFTSRTSPLSGVRLQFSGETSRNGLVFYHAPVTGTDRLDDFVALGISGPYYLSHAPIERGSAEVWLVVISDDPSGREIERFALVDGVDYSIDWEHGVLWLAQAIPGYDETLQPRHLEVAYRSVDVGVVGDLMGLRIDKRTRWGRIGISASKETKGATAHRLLGLDGSITLGEFVSLDYEVGVSHVKDSQGTESGTGLHVTTGSAMTSRLRWGITGDWINGTYRGPGAKEESAGIRLSGSLDYRLGNLGRLTYERQFLQSGEKAARHRDRLRLTSALRGSNRVELRVGVESEGVSAMIGDGRDTRVYAGTGWSWGDRHRLTIDTGLEARIDQHWRLVAPMEFAYRFADAGRAVSVGYRHSLGTHGSGAFIGSVELLPNDGLNLYTRVEQQKDTANLTVGARQGLSLADNLLLTLTVEGRLKPSGSARTAAGFNLVYEPEEGRSKASLSYEIEGAGDNLRRGTRASWKAAVGSAWTLQLSGLWLSGQGPTASSRSVLNEELTLSINYSDPSRSRHTLSAQFITREYTQPGAIGGRDVIRGVSVVGVDWAYRASKGIAVSAKLAGKQEGVGAVASGNGGESYAAAAAALAQVGLEVSLTQNVAVELFHRSLWDSSGASLNGYAAELVYYLSEDLGVSVGTSTMSNDDPDLSLVAPWPEGVYYRVRVKW